MSLCSTVATGTSAIATTLAPGTRFQIEGIQLHLSAAGAAGNLTITIDAGAGAAYDTLLLTQDMTSITDFVWKPTRPILCNNASDAIVVAWANASGRTYGLTIMHSPVS